MARKAQEVIACAIVKDEEADLRATLQSLRECLGNRLAGIVIHDTGSTDRTNEIAVEEGCEVACRRFDDFSSARNACLDDADEMARKAGVPWILMFSAGARFSGTFAPSRARVKALTHQETRGGSVSWLKVGPIRAGSGLRYAGRTHEAIDPGKDPADIPRSGLTVSYASDGKDRRPRWELDLTLLQGDYTPRGRFYYAQTLDCLGRYAEAFSAYATRADLTGYEPERLQAVVNAVRTAPTMFVARTMVALAPECPDVYLELARREQRARFVENAHFAARTAKFYAARPRCMFACDDLDLQVEEILKWGT